jgi:glutaminyl-peptide cyclotransferase
MTSGSSTSILLVCFATRTVACDGGRTPGVSSQTASAQGPAPARYGFTVVNTFAHDAGAFTQGLIFRDGHLYESTGCDRGAYSGGRCVAGASSLRKVRFETGEVLQRRDVATEHFAEGLVDWNDRLIQLTWLSNVGFAYAVDTFEPVRTFEYGGEGWGLTKDDRRLIMSDGTSTLRFLDPDTFAETGRLEVTERGLPVNSLNELEMIDGELFANIWQSDDVVVIAPDTGYVTARIDFRPLRARLTNTQPIDVLNGIAWDGAGRRLFITGKLWPQLFEVQIDRN